MEQAPALFEERFLDKHAGIIINDPATAIVELVANAWDAYATRVEVEWPSQDSRLFIIRDNGKGLNASNLLWKWRTLDFDKIQAEGEFIEPPQELRHKNKRRVYGRNGRGRHGAFAFSDTYEIVSTAEQQETTFEVSRSIAPFEIKEISRRQRDGHGLEIRAECNRSIKMSAERARETIGARFLTDPDFKVYVDGIEVTFDDLPAFYLRESFVSCPGGMARILMIDAQRSDRTTRQHGIAWHVNKRLVGECGWRGSDLQRVLDGRTSEAKRFTFIVSADFWQTP